MKTRIFGKKIVNKYKVVDNLKEIKDDDGELKRIFTAKPKIVQTSSIDNWIQIIPDIDGEIRYNSKWYKSANGDGGDYYKGFNISKNETVYSIDEIYRADLNEIHIFTNKVIEERDEGKEESETRLAELIGDYNEQIITSDEKMTAYCKLHHLDIREADCEEVLKLVYSDGTAIIIDGTVKNNVRTVSFSKDTFSPHHLPNGTYSSSLCLSNEPWSITL